MATAKTIAYGAYGTLGYATSGTSVSVAYPSGIAAGQMPFLQVVQAVANDDISTPADWTKLGSKSEGSGSTGANSAWFAKVATGSESGSLSVSRTGSSYYFYGIIWRTGTGPRTSTSSIQTTTPLSGNSTSASSASITPASEKNYVAVLVTLEDNTSIAEFTGGNYVERFEQDTNQGDDAAFAMDGYQQAGYDTGECRLFLGDLALSVGRWACPLIVFDTAATDGIVWGMVPVEIKAEVEGS